jgi:hypothetical protein
LQKKYVKRRESQNLPLAEKVLKKYVKEGVLKSPTWRKSA